MKSKNKQPHLKEGDILTINITDTGERGDGIGRDEGLVIIVPKTLPGKKYTVKITSIRRSYAFAEIHEE